MVGMAGAGLMREIEGEVPDHLRTWWEPACWSLHTAAWWRWHWERSGILAVETADTLSDGWRLWRRWIAEVAPHNQVEIQALDADRGSFLGYVRLVGRRRDDARLDEPIVSVPIEYQPKPLLRSSPDTTPA
jgi:hypothetical protein